MDGTDPSVPSLEPNDIDVDDEEDSTSSISLTPEEREAMIAQKCSGHSVVSRSLSLINLLGEHVHDPEETLLSQTGPHYDAFVWLVYFDDAILCPPTSWRNVLTEVGGEESDKDNSTTTDVTTKGWEIESQTKRILQRYTLATMYYSTNGDGWTNCSAERRECMDEDGEEAVRFLDATHECSWFGIECDDHHPSSGSLDVDTYVPVTEISLPSNELRGEVPIEFYEVFDRLQVWDMHDNDIDGSLSESIGNLIELETLKL